MLLLQVDVRVCGSSSGSLAPISSRDTVVGQMSTTKALFPRFALSLVEAETGRREERVYPQVCQSCHPQCPQPRRGERQQSVLPDPGRSRRRRLS